MIGPPRAQAPRAALRSWLPPRNQKSEIRIRNQKSEIQILNCPRDLGKDGLGLLLKRCRGRADLEGQPGGVQQMAAPPPHPLWHQHNYDIHYHPSVIQSPHPSELLPRRCNVWPIQTAKRLPRAQYPVTTSPWHCLRIRLCRLRTWLRDTKSSY